MKLIKMHPGIGWVRGDMVPDEGAIEEILTLRRKVEELQTALESIQSSGPTGTANLAQGEDTYEIRFSFIASTEPLWLLDGKTNGSSITADWDQIFSAVAPLMINEASEFEFAKALDSLVSELAMAHLQESEQYKGSKLSSFSINKEDFQTIKVQLRALGLITKSTKSRSVKDTSTYWTLTPYGDNVMTKLRAIRKSQGVESQT